MEPLQGFRAVYLCDGSRGRQLRLENKNLSKHQACSVLLPVQAELDTSVRIMALYTTCCCKKVVLTRELSVSNNSCQDERT